MSNEDEDKGVITGIDVNISCMFCTCCTVCQCWLNNTVNFSHGSIARALAQVPSLPRMVILKGLMWLIQTIY